MGDEFDICRYGSTMGREEKQLLRIVVRTTDDSSLIFPDSQSADVPAYLKHLELEGFGVTQFLHYRSHEYPNLGPSQKLFARRLQDVLLNRVDNSCKSDMYLHDLVDYLIEECHLNDGLHLYTRVSKLPLKVGEHNFLLLSHKEGRNKRGIAWMLQECLQKGKPGYKKGDIQLAASLIAACQANVVQAGGDLKLKTLYGLKVVGEEFFFCRVTFDSDYGKQILTSLPDRDLIVNRSRGLRISKPDDRKKLLYFMHRLKEHTLKEGL